MVKAVAELVKVTVIAVLFEPIVVVGNRRLAGESETGETPFPVKFTTCVFGEALSRRVIAPSIEPTPPGEKLTLTVQVAAGAKLDPQVVVSEK